MMTVNPQSNFVFLHIKTGRQMFVCLYCCFEIGSQYALWTKNQKTREKFFFVVLSTNYLGIWVVYRLNHLTFCIALFLITDFISLWKYATCTTTIRMLRNSFSTSRRKFCGTTVELLWLIDIFLFFTLYIPTSRT